MRLLSMRKVLLGGLAVAALAATGILGADDGSAQGLRRGDDYGYRERQPVAAQPGMTPVFAVVSLNEQRINVYGVNGRVLSSPVSSGNVGYETPAGVFSIVQKKPQHNSNLYDDASMPFMQRITWTGIALHAGALPGYAASHGCVRLPLAFAEQLFGVTKMGMRVILTRDEIIPQDFNHPALFKPRLLQASVEQQQPATPRYARVATRGELPISRIGAHAIDNVLTPSPTSEKYLAMLGTLATSKAAESERSARRANEARQNAQRKAAEAAVAVRNIKAAELNVARAEDGVKAAVKALETVTAKPDTKPEILKAHETAKEKAEARLAETRTQLETAKTQNQAKIDAATAAAEEAKKADIAREDAAEASEEASRRLSPVSVFVSRKMRRVYVRQANLPIMEMPINIKNASDPIGTYVFTALDFADGGTEEMRWSVVSMYKNIRDVKAEEPAEPVSKPGAPTRPSATPAPVASKKSAAKSESFPADVAGARNALDRIELPADVKTRVAELLVPGSSLLISDEAPSIETGKDTDFIVVMTGEPQGALKMRKREPSRRDRERMEEKYSPFSFWNW